MYEQKVIICILPIKNCMWHHGLTCERNANNMWKLKQWFFLISINNSLKDK